MVGYGGENKNAIRMKLTDMTGKPDRYRSAMPAFLEGTDGRIAFTEEGRYCLGIRFAQAGIDIRQIRTRKQYQQAMERSRPWLTRTLQMIASNGEMNDERRALVAIARGEYEKADAIMRRRDSSLNG